MKAYIKNKQGFSLIEVLVALSILFFFIMAFSVLFSNSFSYIFVSGSKTETQYSIQEAAENSYLDSSTVFSDVDTIETFVSGFTIIINDLSEPAVLLDGRIVEMEASYPDSTGNENDILITYFIPSGVTR
jgi:Tfp pilus assembly protein PilV